MFMEQHDDNQGDVMGFWGKFPPGPQGPAAYYTLLPFPCLNAYNQKAWFRIGSYAYCVWPF